MLVTNHQSTQNHISEDHNLQIISQYYFFEHLKITSTVFVNPHVAVLPSITFSKKSIIDSFTLSTNICKVTQRRTVNHGLSIDKSLPQCLPAIAAIHLWGPAGCWHHTETECFISRCSTSKIWVACWITGEGHKHITCPWLFSV